MNCGVSRDAIQLTGVAIEAVDLVSKELNDGNA